VDRAILIHEFTHGYIDEVHKRLMAAWERELEEAQEGEEYDA